MRISIDYQKCTGLGICESIAPDIFEVNDEGGLVLAGEIVPEDLLDHVRQAVEHCPTRALSVRA
jgi:ferredoxin